MIPGQSASEATDLPRRVVVTRSSRLDKKGDIFLLDCRPHQPVEQREPDTARLPDQCVSVPNHRRPHVVRRPRHLGDPDFAIYEEYERRRLRPQRQRRLPEQPLVEVVSHDGVNFQPVITAGYPGPPRPGLLRRRRSQLASPTTTGIPGNQVLAKNGDLLIAHTSAAATR